MRLLPAKTIETLQNRAIRILTHSAYDMAVGLLQRQLRLPGISDMIKQESQSMVYKALNVDAHLYLKEQSTIVECIVYLA